MSIRSTWAFGILCGLLWPALVSVGGPVRSAGEFLYIPPSAEKHVLFYHSFSRGASEPEINRLGAKVGKTRGRLTPALTDPGLTPAKGGRAVGLAGVRLPLNRPVTVSLWFRLDEHMEVASGFHLISLRTPTGYISNFVRGKGGWCALTRPTFVVQLYRFPGISNVNGIRFGDAWLAEKVWHHAAVTVSEGSRVRVYWDGRLRSDTTAKGRLFGPKDVVTHIDLGPHWLGHPMTIDELLVLRCAWSGEQVAAYVSAVRKLAEAGFGFRVPRAVSAKPSRRAT